MKNVLNLLAILVCVVGYSQTKTIKGTVYYQETNEPVPFAYVKLKDVAYGTVTEYDGTFSLKIPSKYFDSILEFSYVGLKTYEYALNTYSAPIKVLMETDITELYTVVVSAKRDLNPKSVLKKAIKAIPDNYVNEDFNLDGYYREYVKENDKPVKYADAAFTLDLKPYTGKEEKRKRFENPVDLSGVTTIGSWVSRSSSLHRWHFHQRVLKGEKAKIIEAKSSDDLNTTRLYSNVQGGPLSALTKDRLKYPKNFLTNFGKYEYTLLEVEKNNEGYFLINFVPAITPEKLKKKNQYFNYEYKLGGSILIRKEDMAITEINYSVPPEYKQFICGYRGWSVRHFDFSVESKYAKIGDEYVLAYLKHSDEFIVEDTATDRRIPYAAISEFFTNEIKTSDRVTVTSADNFSNSDYNYLFDLPEGYNTKFWAKYGLEYPESKVPDFIRVAMSSETNLEKQFADKLRRDTTLMPPVAAKEPVALQIHGQKIQDNYAWLKDTKNPLGNEQIMKYLSEENGYTNNYFKPLKPLQRELFKEVRSYVQDNYQSLAREEGGYKYYYKYAPEEEYARYYRKSKEKGSKEELLFDVNKMAQDKSYYAFGGYRISPGNKVIAYSENTTGNDKWTLKFKYFDEDKPLPFSLDYVTGITWLTDSTLIYVKAEEKTFRSSKVFKLNLSSGEQQIIYHEKDTKFAVGVSKSRSKQFVFIASYASDQNEIRLLNLNNPEDEFRLVTPRRKGHKYSLSHFEDKFYVLTNHKAPNNKVMVSDTSSFEEDKWKLEIAENPEIEISGVLPFKRWMVFQERHGLEYKIRVVNKIESKEHYIKQGNDRAVYLGENNDFDTDTLRISKVNYHRPARILDYNMEKKKFKFLKSEGGITPTYFSKVETLYAKAKDGTDIPITLIYNKNLIKNQLKEGKIPPLYITGYGSYGSSYSAGYNPNMAPLIQKGFVYAIAHVRGGGDLGEKWYTEGKMLKKKNTFSDFITCTDYLIAQGYGEAGKVFAEGGSAGGLLMGAIANMRPDLYKLLILDVPFVDVINTMMDEKLPLTSLEYDEWGNPNEKKYFKYIKSYSPYENVEAKAYPNMLFLTAINDSRVGYWEPAKMVAKLRELKTDKNEVLLRTDFSAGHGGASGRYASLSQTAFKYALILDMLNSDN